MSFETRLAVVKYIINLRNKYLEALYPGFYNRISVKTFDRIYDNVLYDIKMFSSQTNVGIDPILVFMEDEKFEVFVKTGRIKEFINMEIIKN